MVFALPLLVAGYLIGVAVSVATAGTKTPEPPPSAAELAPDAGTTARITALEAGVARPTRAVEGLRFELEAAPTQRGNSASRASAPAVRLVLDTDRAAGWSQIDAVEIVGPDGSAWALGATASSWCGGD